MIFVSAGYGIVELEGDLFFAQNGPILSSNNISSTEDGFRLSIGQEWVLTDNISGRLQISYEDYSNTTDFLNFIAGVSYRF